MRCALVNTQTNKVENIILADPQSDPAPNGYIIIGISEDSQITHDWEYDTTTKTFIEPPRPPPPLPTEQDYSNSIQFHIDKIAQSKNYKDGFALSTYATSSESQWKQEAETFILWRDSVWKYAFTELEKVKSGTRSQPTIEEILAELPVITW